MPLDFIKKLADKILRPADNDKSAPKSRSRTSEPQKPAGNRQTTATKGQKTLLAKPAGAGGGRADKPQRKKARDPRPYANTEKTTPPRQEGGVRDKPQRRQSLVVGRPAAKPNSGATRQGKAEAGSALAKPKTRPGGAIDETLQAQHLAEHATWTLEQFQVAPEEGKKRFHDFALPSALMHAVADLGFKYCTPIQALSLEHALAGKHVVGRAQTGTGKTAAFLVAILTRYLATPQARQEKGGTPRALVIAPTRELVIQICKDAANIGKYCSLRSLAVYGGMDYEQQKREVLGAPVDLLVATPGRLLDFVRSRVVDLSRVDTLVIDEADRMLDMGFIPDVRSIVRRLPAKEKRCTMLYSATLDDTVMRLADQWLHEPIKVEVESESVTTKTVRQIVYVVTSNEKFTVLYNLLQHYPDSRTLVFCNRRGTTEDVAQRLKRHGINCDMLSGDVQQNRRLRVLEDFRAGKVRTVVATDVAGRGLHVDNIGFVINYDFPYEPEDYVHRIGRTGRAGHTGTAISFADEDESFIIPEIEKYIGEDLKCTLLAADDPLMVKLPVRNVAAAPARERDTAQKQQRGDKPASGRSASERPRQKPQTARQHGRQEGRAHPKAVAAKPVRVVEVAPPRQETAPSTAKPAVAAPQVKDAAPTAPVVPATGTPRRIVRFSEEWVPGE